MITKDTDKKLFLLDAFALIFRSYYAFIKNPRYNSKGQNTSAILGFVNTLEEILKKEKPTHIAVVFDPPKGNFRKKIYPEYKAQRKETPEDIILSVPHIKNIIEAFNIPVIEIPEFEADDTIGTLAKMAEKQGFTTYMMTPDKDYAQLVSDTTFMYKPKRGGGQAELVGAKEICERYKITDPTQFIDILAIWGDTSDNIKGIPGVGEKTAQKLISKYGSIKGIYENISDLKGKQKENIENSVELVKLSKQLVTIVLDVPVEFNEEELKLTKPNYEKLKELFRELEFNALATRILPKAPQPQQGNLFGFDAPETLDVLDEIIETAGYKDIKNTEHNYILLSEIDKIKEFAQTLSFQSEFCFDTETTSTDAIDAKLVGIAFSYFKNEAYYIPVNKDNKDEIIEIFKPILENENILKIGQNLKYDISVLVKYGINVKGKIFDTMLAHYLIAPDKRHNLKVLSENYLNYSPEDIETLIGKKGKNQLTMDMVSIEKIKEYAGEDADLTFQLKEILHKELQKNDLLEIAENIEFPLVKILSDMELEGVNLDTEILHNYANELSDFIKNIEEKIYKLSGTTFNIASPKQLGIVLFEKLKITDKPKLTKTKQYATGESELQKLKSKHEIIKEILDYRSYSKLLSTYVLALPKLVNEKTKRLHTSYNQAVTTTGRLSSTNPNLQNIPIRTDAGKKIRQAFISASENHVLLAADYSQIELRLIADLSQDENMIDAFNNGYDIHAITAAKINKVELEEVTREMRSHAKSANFGIIYGISAFGLAENLQISRSEAKKLIDGYFDTYPKVKKYMDESIANARKIEFVETKFGRRRYLRNINSNNSLVRSNDERNAINAPIQGTAADIIKIAMTNCKAKFDEANLKSKMILQVHDELIFDVLKEELDEVKQIVKQEMENVITLSIPLTVDIGTGHNWLEAH